MDEVSAERTEWVAAPSFEDSPTQSSRCRALTARPSRASRTKQRAPPSPSCAPPPAA